MNRVFFLKKLREREREREMPLALNTPRIPSLEIIR
jgi:hypothetical protein